MSSFFFVCFQFWFWAILICSQSLLLIHHSRITPGKLRRPYKVSGVEPKLVSFKVNVLPTVLSIQSLVSLLNIIWQFS